MQFSRALNVLIGASTIALANVQTAAATPRSIAPATTATPSIDPAKPGPGSAEVARLTEAALGAFTNIVRPLSHPKALEDAFVSYFNYQAAHPADIRKPYLYFVDYGLASTEKRGYVFDMKSLKIVDGPFTVAHGRGSSTSQFGKPTRFSNGSGSAMTSLGLYLTKAIYSFTGKSAGHPYSSIGLRLDGVSDGFNDRALARGVVAHGAPYVTPTRAGRSEGCPAMEPSRAERLLPMLADGAMVFLFAPDQNWLNNDPWVTGNAL